MTELNYYAETTRASGALRCRAGSGIVVKLVIQLFTIDHRFTIVYFFPFLSIFLYNLCITFPLLIFKFFKFDSLLSFHVISHDLGFGGQLSETETETRETFEIANELKLLKGYVQVIHVDKSIIYV